MTCTPTVRAGARRAAAVLAAAFALVLLAAGPAQAQGPAESGAPRVHHVFPEDGAVLRDAPDHFEIMFDVLLVPGAVQVGVVPSGSDRLVALPGSPVLDGPLLVQPLPPLPAGRYTVGVRLRGPDGRISGGTFGFAVDPTAPAAPDTADASASAGPGTGTGRWLAPLVGAVLLLPALALVRRARLRRRRPGPVRAPAGPARAAGRTPTSASSPGDPPGR